MLHQIQHLWLWSSQCPLSLSVKSSITLLILYQRDHTFTKVMLFTVQHETARKVSWMRLIYSDCGAALGPDIRGGLDVMVLMWFPNMDLFFGHALDLPITGNKCCANAGCAHIYSNVIPLDGTLNALHIYDNVTYNSSGYRHSCTQLNNFYFRFTKKLR